MLENEPTEGPAASSEDTNISKQAACHECRRSKVKCVRPPDAAACKKCASAGIECVVPKYHVGRYKGVKNKRSGLEKAIHQVEEAVKKARTNGLALHDGHAQTLQKILEETKGVVQSENAQKRKRDTLEHTVQTKISAPKVGHPVVSPRGMFRMQDMEREALVQSLENDGDVTLNNANNPLQLLAIASSIPDPIAPYSSSSLGKSASPSAATEEIGENGETDDFFSPMISRLDLKKEFDPLELGLVSKQEVSSLFEYFYDQLAHTRWGLDRALHSAAFVRSRSAYLFTSIMACSALFLPDTAPLSTRLNNHCKYLAREIMFGGYRSLEIVLAYMINIPWMQPGKNWATDDETCSYISAAMTIAIDLSLNKIIVPSSTIRPQGVMERVSPADCIESQRALNMDCHGNVNPSSMLARRLIRARERAWIALFTLERGICLARGRPWTVPTGPLIETCDAWHISEIADPWDGSLIAAAVLRRDFGTLVADVRATCDNFHVTGGEGGNIVKVMREKVEGFFTRWYHTWIYQIQQRDGSLPPYVDILVSHTKLSAYCNVINHPTASAEVRQFFRAAGLTAALHVVKSAVQNESRLHSMPNNLVIMVSFAACFVLGLITTTKRGSQISITDHVQRSVTEAADVLERIGSNPAHRRGASKLFGQHIKRIMRQHAASAGPGPVLPRTEASHASNTSNAVPASGTHGESSISSSSAAAAAAVVAPPYTLHSISDDAAAFFRGLDSMTEDQLLEMIQNSRDDDVDAFNAPLLSNEDSLFMDWLDWPNLI